MVRYTPLRVLFSAFAFRPRVGLHAARVISAKEPLCGSCEGRFARPSKPLACLQSSSALAGSLGLAASASRARLSEYPRSRHLIGVRALVARGYVISGGVSQKGGWSGACVPCRTLPDLVMG